MGVPSASGAPGYREDPAAYNLIAVEDGADGWRCTLVRRGFARESDAISELGRLSLAG